MAFLIFPTKTNSFNVESLRGHAVTKGLKDTIDEIQKDIGKRMYEICLRGVIPDSAELLAKNDIVKLKRCVFAQGSSALPPITTHNIQVRKKKDVRKKYCGTSFPPFEDESSLP